MGVFETIRKRRSIRRFDTTKEIPDKQIEKILEAGRLAPSAHNLQDWYFIVVKNSNLKKKLVEAAMGQKFIAEASIIIVVCADLRVTDKQSSGHGENFYAIQDTAIAATQMWLTLTELGLGACWIGAFDEEKVKQILNLKNHLRPMILLPVGYPAEFPIPRPRKEINQISKKIE